MDWWVDAIKVVGFNELKWNPNHLIKHGKKELGILRSVFNTEPQKSSIRYLKAISQSIRKAKSPKALIKNSERAIFSNHHLPFQLVVCLLTSQVLIPPKGFGATLSA